MNTQEVFKEVHLAVHVSVEKPEKQANEFDFTAKLDQQSPVYLYETAADLCKRFERIDGLTHKSDNKFGNMMCFVEDSGKFTVTIEVTYDSIKVECHTN